MAVLCLGRRRLGFARRLSRVLAVVLAFAIAVYRFGEAANLGPYSYGGASSSGAGVGPGDVVPDVHCGAAAGRKPVLGQFDDPDDWEFGVEEDIMGKLAVCSDGSGGPATGQGSLCGHGFDDQRSRGLELFAAVSGAQGASSSVSGLGDADTLDQGGEFSAADSADPWNRVADRLFGADQAVPAAPISCGSHLTSSVFVPGRWAHLGTEAERAAARSAAAGASAAIDSACPPVRADGRSGGEGLFQLTLPSVDALTPAQAWARRCLILRQERLVQSDARGVGRRTRAMQERAFCRPRRKVTRNVVIATANVNAFTTLHEELQHGHVIPQADYVAIQEHLCRGDACDRAARDVASLGWDGVFSDAYFKDAGPGGGTAVIAKKGLGAVRLPIPERFQNALQGRCTASYVDVLGGIALVSYYGRSGLPIAGQLQVLAALGQVVKGLGLPFIIGGDWQVSPQMLLESQFPHRLAADIVAAEGPTNLRAGSSLDYFLVARVIRAAVVDVEVRADLFLSPHAPVMLNLAARSVLGFSRALSQPRVLPAGDPRGPMPPAAAVQWEGAAPVEVDFARRLDHWYAGAEFELMGLFGLQGADDEGAHLGLGCHGREVERRVGGRYCGSPDQLGLVGQRLAWTMRSAKAVSIAGSSLPVSSARGPRCSPPLDALLDYRHPYFHFCDNPRAVSAARCLVAVGRRSAAFAAELKQLRMDESLAPFVPLLRKGLESLAAVARPHHGSPPLVACWAIGSKRNEIDQFGELANDLAGCLSRAVAAKKQRELASIRQWARTATLKQAHAATKPCAFVAAHSASPSKGHRGELTPQAAADVGRAEWARVWHAVDGEVHGLVGRIMQALPAEGDPPSRFFAVDDGPYVPLDLPPISPEKLRVVLRSFRTGTAVGVDWVRLRHLALLSGPALAELASILEAMELGGSLPAALAGTVAVALAKRSGGSRLIGVAAALYRCWSKIRYADLRDELEARLARSFLAAAPQQGSLRAVSELALRAEQAQLKGLESAAALVDISKFYESLDLVDVAQAADYMGVPRPVISLCLSFYLAPRRIRVGRSWSKPLFPQRSIVAGCTWAMIYIRCLILGPAERFLAELRALACGHELNLLLRIYVDDVTLLVSSALERLKRFVTVAAGRLVSWISGTLKLAVARDKLVCIASSVAVRRALQPTVGALGYKVVLVAPCLGADFTAGGIYRARLAFARRLRAAARRKPRLRWWRGLGAPTAAVARGGIAGSATHAVEVSGLPPTSMRALRRAMAAAAPIQAVGASLSARLALGGDKAAESDPRVLFHNMPLRFIMSYLWDVVGSRQEFVRAWYLLREKCDGMRSKKLWQNVRGPMSAAWAHLVDIGVVWVSPFVFRSRGIDVSFLDLPPGRAYQLLAEHARITVDHELLIRHATDFGCDGELVLDLYQRGIDWASLRWALTSERSPLAAVQRRALGLVATDAIWEEERKWLAGFLPTGSCLLCFCGIGTKEHRLCSCLGVVQALDWARAAGAVQREAPEIADPALAPLRLFGWAPVAVERAVAPSRRAQGFLVLGRVGRYYGDGSCLWPQMKACESAAWSLVYNDGSGGELPGSSAGLPGLFGTSFRGELMAIVQFFKVAGPGSSFAGDCKSIVDAVALGVPPHLATAASRDADLWSRLRRLVRERRGDRLLVYWTRAHRSRAVAARAGAEALMDWAGNRAADELAKSAAARHGQPTRARALQLSTQLTARHLTRLALAASVGLDRCGGVPRRRGKRVRSVGGSEAFGGHVPIPLRGGGWHCKLCRIRAITKASVRTFRAVPCRGNFLSRAHPSHTLSVLEGVVWCGRCGAYSVEKMVGLARPCPGHPTTPSSARRLQLLRGGEVPAASENAAVRLSLADHASSTSDAGFGQPVAQTPAAEPRAEAHSPRLAAARPRRDSEVRAFPATPVGVYLRLQPDVAAERAASRSR